MSGTTGEERPRSFLSAPLLALSASFALGIVLTDAPRATLAWTLARTPVLLALVGAAVLAGLILVRAMKFALAGVVALIGFALAGSIAARLFEFRFPPAHISHLENLGIALEDPVRISGRIVSSPFQAGSDVQFDVEVSEVDDRGRAIPLQGNVRLRLKGTHNEEAAAHADELQFGDSIRALATLERPTSYHNPGAFDFRRRMVAIEDTYWQGTIKTPELIEKLLRGKSPGLDELRLHVRDALLEGIDRLYPPWSVEGRDGSVLKAVLLGDRSSLDSETINDFRITGLYHLLVISGMNIAMLAMLAGFFFDLFRIGQTAKSALVLTFVLGYSALIVQSAPTMRATLMIVIYLIARFFYREHAGLNSIGLAALILLVARPPWLFEAGFVLSFTAALLIVGLVAPILERTIEPYRRALVNVSDVAPDLSLLPRQAQFRLDVRATIAWLEARSRILRAYPAVANAVVVWPLRAVVWGVGMIVFTTIIQIGLMLPLAATFHRVTFAGIGLNALAIPVMTAILAVAVPTVALGAVWPAVAVWPAKLLAFLMRLLFFLTDLPHLPPWLSYRVPTPPAWVGWAFALALVVTAWGFGRSRWTFRVAAVGTLVFAAIISTSPFSPRVQSGHLEVTALDCGGGGAFLAILPDRTTLLIDSGDFGRANSEDPFESRRWSAGEDIVSPYLWSRQIKRIDIVVMSRGTDAELPGFAAMARNFRVGEWWHTASGLSPKTLEFLDELHRRGARLRAVKSGDRFDRGSAVVEILFPPEVRNEVEMSQPVSSGLALRIEDGESNVFFARNPDRSLEKTLTGSGASLRSDVLVLANADFHGGENKNLLASVSPQVLLLSGEGRRTRDSSSSNFSGELQMPGLRFFRTQRDGAVTVVMQGHKISVRPYGAVAGEGTAGFGSVASLTSSSFRVR